jgi:hypothetical protein
MKEEINKTLLEDYEITQKGPRALLTVYICRLIEKELEAGAKIVEKNRFLQPGEIADLIRARALEYA